MATPIDDASSRWGSRVEFSATTAKTTSPGWRYFTPSLRASSLQLGGKMEETRTRFWAAIPASRNANSNEVSRSRCFPTPLVKKIRFGTISLPKSVVLRKEICLNKNAQSNTMLCKGNMNLQARPKKNAGTALESVPAGCDTQLILQLILRSRGDSRHHAGVVLLCPSDRDVRASLFVENRQGCFIAGVES